MDPNWQSNDANIDKIYQRIGEFVVSYQWLEQKFREIGWLILDPRREEWPSKKLRTENSEKLIDTVETLFVDLMHRLDPPDRDERIKDFQSLVAGCHAMRKYRNSLLHSAFIELKAGGEVMGVVRSNPKTKIDAASGDMILDQAELTDEAISKKIGELGNLAFPLGQHYLQLIHWAPFDTRPKLHTPVIPAG